MSRVSPLEYISGSQFVALSSCYCIQKLELPPLKHMVEKRRGYRVRGGTYGTTRAMTRLAQAAAR